MSQVIQSDDSGWVQGVTIRAWVVCLAASLFFFYEFVQMMMFNVINPSLMQAFGVSATGVGKISSAYFIANVLFMFPAGVLLDRFSTKKIILTAMVLCVFGTICFSFATHIYFAMICRFLTGIGGSFPFLCCLRLSTRWFPVRRWALVSGVMVTVAFLGGVAGQAPMSFLIGAFGWRHALQVDALFGIFFIYVIYRLVQDYPLDYREGSHRPGYFDEVKPQAPIWRSISNACLNPQNWFYGLATSMLNLPVMLLGAIWGGLYLSQVFGFTMTQASYITSMIFFGTIVGSPIWGWLSDTCQLRRLPMLVAGVLSLILMLVIMYIPGLSFGALVVLFFLLGLITSAQIITYPAISESNPSKMSASALGLASVLIMGAPAIFQPFFGWLMDYGWQGHVVAGVSKYTEADFHRALLLLPIAFLVGIVMIALAKETQGRFLGENK